MKKIEATQNNLLKPCLEEIKLLDSLFKKAQQKKIPVVDKDTGRFLEIVSLIRKPENILEIGCGIGFSSYFIIKNLKGGNYTGVDLNKERLKKAEKFIKGKFPGEKCKFLAGNALKIIPEIEPKFDMIFIDGAKYEYLSYLKAVEGKLNPGALIIADNIFYRGLIFKKKVSVHDCNSVNGIKEYIKYINGNKYFESYFFDIGDGISVTKFLSDYFK
jgi:predicted O-methyltransferase YrrM